jgi:hypothetical protein
MFTALLLQAFGDFAFPLAACAVALAAELVFRRYGAVSQLVACAGLLAVLSDYASAVLGRTARHVL